MALPPPREPTVVRVAVHQPTMTVLLKLVEPQLQIKDTTAVEHKILLEIMLPHVAAAAAERERLAAEQQSFQLIMHKVAQEVTA